MNNERMLGFPFASSLFLSRFLRPEIWDVAHGAQNVSLRFCTAAAAEAKDLDQGLRQIEAVRQLPGQLLEIDELSFNVLDRFAAGTNQVVMRFEIAVHAQGGRMRRDLSQQTTLDEKPQIIVNRGQ